MGEEYDRRTVMRRVYIVVEGQTEQEFVNTVISPYLQEFGVFNITPVLIRTRKEWSVSKVL